MSDSVKLVTSLKTYTGTLSGDTDQVLVVHNNNETVRVPFDQFKNSQTVPVVPTSPTSDGTEGAISVTENAVYTYVNGEWGKSPRDLDWGAEYLRIDQGNVIVTQEQKDVLRDRLPAAEENAPGIVPLAVDHTKSYSTNYAASPAYVRSYIKSLNPENVVIGLSAYDIAVENGFRGTEEEWLESLRGPQGIEGPSGPQGPEGPQGPAGESFDYYALTDEEKQLIVSPAMDLLENKSYPTLDNVPSGNATGDCIRLHDSRVKDGIAYSRVVIPMLNTVTTPVYMAAFVKRTSDSTVLARSISKLPITWTAGTDAVWEFSIPFTKEPGCRVDLYLALTEDAVTATGASSPGVNFSAKAIAVSDESVSGVRSNGQLRPGIVCYVEFVSVGHLDNYDMHFTPGEKGELLGSIETAVTKADKADINVGHVTTRLDDLVMSVVDTVSASTATLNNGVNAILLSSDYVPHKDKVYSIAINPTNTNSTAYYMVAYVKAVSGKAVRSVHTSDGALSWTSGSDVTWTFSNNPIVIPDDCYLELYFCANTSDVGSTEVSSTSRTEVISLKYESVTDGGEIRWSDTNWYKNRVCYIRFTKDNTASIRDMSAAVSRIDSSVDQLFDEALYWNASMQADTHLESQSNNGRDNYNGAHGFGWKMKSTGTVYALDITCSISADSIPSGPMGIKIWGDSSTLLTKSVNLQQHVGRAVLHYVLLTPIDVVAGQMLYVTFHTEANMSSNTFGSSAAECLRLADVNANDGEAGGMLTSSDNITLSYTNLIAVCSWRMKVSCCRYALTPTMLHIMLGVGPNGVTGTHTSLIVPASYPSGIYWLDTTPTTNAVWSMMLKDYAEWGAMLVIPSFITSDTTVNSTITLTQFGVSAQTLVDAGISTPVTVEACRYAAVRHITGTDTLITTMRHPATVGMVDPDTGEPRESYYYLEGTYYRPGELWFTIPAWYSLDIPEVYLGRSL